jgi:hypothetical protein
MKKVININIDIKDNLYFYFYYDSQGFRTTTEGFDSRVDAQAHATARFSKTHEVNFYYK